MLRLTVLSTRAERTPLWPAQLGHIDRCTHEFAVIPLSLPGWAPIVRAYLKTRRNSEELVNWRQPFLAARPALLNLQQWVDFAVGVELGDEHFAR